jgi:membrane protein involved in colicin uptake
VKLYKGEAECNADLAQVKIMEAAGWSKVKPEVKNLKAEKAAAEKAAAEKAAAEKAAAEKAAAEKAAAEKAAAEKAAAQKIKKIKKIRK